MLKCDFDGLLEGQSIEFVRKQKTASIGMIHL